MCSSNKSCGDNEFEDEKSSTALRDNGSHLLEVVPIQNYPNPFNPSTTIKYDLPQASHVTLTVYDLLGREVATLVNNVEEPGHKSVEWNAAAVASGVYFYQLKAGEFVRTKKLLLFR
jgi:hypothetical protein